MRLPVLHVVLILIDTVICVHTYARKLQLILNTIQLGTIQHCKKNILWCTRTLGAYGPLILALAECLGARRLFVL